MPYRTGRSAVVSRAVLCAGCGERAGVRAADETFVCARCAVDQPAVRGESEVPAIREMVAVGHQGVGYAELGEIARSVGIAESCTQITLRCDGVECTVTLDINSGHAVGIDMEAKAGGFPEVKLTTETQAERSAKARGVTREVQTGDEAFDRAVFVDSAASDEDLKVVLGSPAVRAGIVRLLKQYRSVTLGPAGVSASSNRTAPGCFRPESVREELAAIRVVAGAQRPMVATITRRSTVARVLLVGTWVLSPLTFVGAVATMILYPPVNDDFFVAAALVGVVLAALPQPFLGRAMRGRSSSHRDLVIVRIGVLASVGMLTIAGALGANALFDRSPEREDTLRILSVDHDREDEHATGTTARGPADLGTIEVDFEDPQQKLRAGDTITTWSKRGALGARWYTRKPVAHSDDNRGR